MAKIDLGRVVGKSAYEIACDNGFVGSEQEWLESLDGSNYDDSEIKNSINAINNKIPAQASSTNQLADKDFVNSSIATATSEFVGTFNSLNELQATTETYDNNDYAFVIGKDSDGNTEYNKYKWNGSEWIFEYTLNNSSFTSEQWKAINSNVTDEWRQSVNTSISNKADKTHSHDNYATKSDLNGLAVSGHTHSEYSKTITFTKSDETSNVFYYLIAKTYSKDSVSNMDTIFLNGSDFKDRMFEGVIRTRDSNMIYNCGKNDLPLEFYSQSDGTINIYWKVSDKYNRIALNVSASQNMTIYSGNLINVTPTGTKMTFITYDYKCVGNLNIKNFGSPAGTTRYVELTSLESFAGVEVNIAYSGKWYFSNSGSSPLYFGSNSEYGLSGYAWGGTDNNKLYLRFNGYRGVSVSVLGANTNIVTISDWTTTAPTGITFKNDEYDIKAEIDGKAVSGHTHDDRYYTESEIDTKLNNKKTYQTISTSAMPMFLKFTMNNNAKNQVISVTDQYGGCIEIFGSAYSSSEQSYKKIRAIRKSYGYHNNSSIANKTDYKIRSVSFDKSTNEIFVELKTWATIGVDGAMNTISLVDSVSDTTENITLEFGMAQYDSSGNNITTTYATKAELSGKSDTSHTHSDYATKDDILNHTHNDTYYTELEIDNLLKNKSDTSHTHSDYASKTDLNNKVDKVYGKQLSTNDFTNTDKSNLDSLKSTVSSLQSTIRNLQDKIENLEDRVSDIEWQIR